MGICIYKKQDDSARGNTLKLLFNFSFVLPGGEWKNKQQNFPFNKIIF